MSIIDQLSQKKISEIALKMRAKGISLDTIKACTGIDLTKS